MKLPPFVQRVKFCGFNNLTFVIIISRGAEKVNMPSALRGCPRNAIALKSKNSTNELVILYKIVGRYNGKIKQNSNKMPKLFL